MKAWKFRAAPVKFMDMVNQSRRLYAVALDFAACALAFFIANQALPRVEEMVQATWPSPPVSEVWPVAIAVFPLLAILLLLTDFYDIRRTATPLQILRELFTPVAFTVVIFGLVSVLAGGPLASARKWILLTALFSLFLLWGARIRFPDLFGRQGLLRHMLLVGAHTFAIRAIKRFAREHSTEINLVGVIDSYKHGVYFENLGLECFGGKEMLAKVLETKEVDTIVVLNDQTEYADEVIRLLDGHPKIKEVYVRAQIPLFMAQDIEILFVQEVPLLKVFGRSDSPRTSLARDVFDKTLAIVGMLILAPVFAIVSLLVRLDSYGPVFYRQKRLGKDNKPFWIFKFRSMYSDAEKRSGAVLAQKNDPRVTRIGRFLRATRLDEIPQLINVASGDMSIIGPRPERPEFQNAYLETIPWFPLRSLCKPGITGLAQVSGDYHTSTQRKLLYDVTYLANMSFLLDLRILLSTVVTVVTKRGH